MNVYTQILGGAFVGGAAISMAQRARGQQIGNKGLVITAVAGAAIAALARPEVIAALKGIQMPALSPTTVKILKGTAIVGGVAVGAVGLYVVGRFAYWGYQGWAAFLSR